MTKACDHDLCPTERCHYARITFEQYGRERPLRAIENSGVRIGQRYKSWQHGDTGRIIALGLSTTGELRAMVAFEIEETSVTHFMDLKSFTDDYLGSHKCWELLPPRVSSDGEPIVDHVVHVLHHGAAVGGCFPGRVPGVWPAGHTWVRITDIEEATCTPCVAAAKAKDPA